MSTTTPTRPAPAATHSIVLETPPADPDTARRHFAHRLEVECDASDVMRDVRMGVGGFVLLDARSPQQFEECHLPTAVNVPHRQITAERMAEYPPDTVFVTYCWGPGCNAATRAALRLASLGFRVKEMIGGTEYWRLEGGPVEGTLGTDAPLVG